MRIAIDARELQGKPTGVGRYLGQILAAWNDLPAPMSHDFVLCAPQHLNTPQLGRLRISTITAPGGGTLWEQLVLPRLVRRASADVLFAPGYTGPLRGSIPMVVAIHDVSFAAHPEWFRWKEGLRRRMLTRMAARRAVRVVTISEFSKGEIVDRLGVDAEKIDVIYPGVTSWTHAARAFTAREADRKGQADRKGPPRIENDKLVLYVGSLFNRRHIPELIEGFARVARRQEEARLEIVGDNRTTPRVDVDRLVNATGVGDRIRVRAYVDDEDLASLYGRARAFAFLSEYEGFGLTPLEALAAGVPSVVLDTPVAREIYRDAALYVDRPDPTLIAEALTRVLVDEAERDRLLNAARPVLARYSWRDCAARVLDVLTSSATATRRG